MRTLLLLITCWAAGLAAYAAALAVLRGEILSLDNWTVIGSITLLAWLLASGLVILPVLRRLATRRSGFRGGSVLPVAGAALAVIPLWLNIGLWYGWHPRHLLIGEAGLLAVLYATSGLLLGLLLASIHARSPAER